MKNVFTYRDGVPDGEPFAVKRVNETLAERKRASDKENKRFCRYFHRSEYLEFLNGALFLLGFFCLTWGIVGFTEKDGAGNQAWAIAVTAIGGVLCLAVLALFGYLLNREILTKFKDKYSAFREERRKLFGELLTEFVAASADTEKYRTDVFGCRYCEGKSKQKRYPACAKKFLAFDTIFWRKENAFCVFDGIALYEFPLKEIVKMERIGRRVRFYGWNKKKPFAHIRYKPYKIRKKPFKEKYSTIAYYRLVFARDGEEYEILIPNYEKETLEKLLGKTLS